MAYHHHHSQCLGETQTDENLLRQFFSDTPIPSTMSAVCATTSANMSLPSSAPSPLVFNDDTPRSELSGTPLSVNVASTSSSVGKGSADTIDSDSGASEHLSKNMSMVMMDPVDGNPLATTSLFPPVDDLSSFLA